MIKLDQALKRAFADLRYEQLRLAAFDFATSGLRQSHVRRVGFDAADDAIRAMLCDAEIKAWRRLEMWGVLIPNDDLRKEIGRMVYQRFLTHSAEIMKHLGIVTPYAADEEDAFRAEIDELAKNLGLDPETGEVR